MNTSEIVTVIASSTLLASILSSIINLWINKILKKNDFKNEYFKKVIDKRMVVYENLENQISLLKMSVMDQYGDKQAYHVIFSMGNKHFIESTKPISYANSKNIWLNSKTRKKALELIHIFNDIRFSDEPTDERLIEEGKKYYWKITELRDELEYLVQEDILKLYDFSKIKTEVESIENSGRRLVK